jgi:hypothetical protein
MTGRYALSQDSPEFIWVAVVPRVINLKFFLEDQARTTMSSSVEPTTSFVGNSRGSALIVAVLAVAAITAVIGMSIFSRSQSIVKTGKVYREQVTKTQVVQELEFIFATPALCKSMIKISGSTFQITSGFQVGTGADAVLSSDSKFSILAMRLENIVDLGAGAKSADFVVITKNTADPKETRQHRSAFNAAYTADAAGNLTDCHIIMTLPQACAELGMVYSGGRCQLCEKLGGSWSGTACSLSE